jgi:hypothetical protein
VSWLASAHPLLNWTLPAPHVFSFPGWYHAAYLVVASSAIGAAGAVLARRVQLAAPSVRAHVAALPATAASCGFGVSFGLVLWIDSIDSLHTSAGAGSALGALGAAVFTVVLATVVLGPRRAIQPLAAGALIAAVVFGGTVLTQGIPG